MMSRLVRRIRRLGSKLGFERGWSHIAIAAGIGLIMGTLAMAFILPLRWIERWSEGADVNLLLWLVPTAPIVGMFLSGLVMPSSSGRNQAPGVSMVMYAVHRLKSNVPFLTAARKWIASTLTIGSGGSAGAEGPIVTIGSAIGSTLARLLKSNPQNTATFLGCGAAAGISSVFNAPIAGIFFVMEILLRDFSLRTFTPIVIASVVSTAWTQAILGQADPLFLVHPDFFRGGYHFSLIDIPNYLLLGLVCGVAASLFIRGLVLSEDVFEKVKAPRITKPAIGAVVLGMMGFAYLILPGTQHSLPPFYGNGYPVIKELISPHTYELTEDSLMAALGLTMLVLSWGLLKGFATCVTIGSGGSGGLFAPSLLMGAAVGGAFGQLMNSLDWFPAASPAHYALVGMAGMIAASTHAPLTGILIVYEVTLLYELILPLMLTAVISTIAGRLMFRESVYTFKLTQLGVRIGELSDLTILRRLSVRDVALFPAVVVRTDESAQKLLELSEEHMVSDFVVVDKEGEYEGMVTRSDLAAALVYREAIPLLQVYELQRSDLPTVTQDDTLDLVLDKFSKHDVHSLAVLDPSDDGEIRGLITRPQLMDCYHSALSSE